MTPHPSTPHRDGSRTALIAGIVVTALLLVGVGVTALVLGLSGGGDDQDGKKDDDTTAAGQTPEEAMREFVDATNEVDCELLADHPITGSDSVQDCEDTVEKARDDAETHGFDFDSFTLSIDDLEVVSESDTEAIVVVDVTQGFTVDRQVSAEPGRTRLSGGWKPHSGSRSVPASRHDEKSTAAPRIASPLPGPAPDGPSAAPHQL